MIGYLVGLPARGWGGRHHLFRRPGQASLCGLWDWIECSTVAATAVGSAWVCFACAELAEQELA